MKNLALKLNSELHEWMRRNGKTADATMADVVENLASGAEDAEAFRAAQAVGGNVVNNWLQRRVAAMWVPAVLRTIEADDSLAREELTSWLAMDQDVVDDILARAVALRDNAIFELVTATLKSKSSGRGAHNAIHPHDVWWWMVAAHRAVPS